MRAAIRHVLSASREQGHCYLIITQIIAVIEELLNLRLAETIPARSCSRRGSCRVRLLAEAGGELAPCYYSKSIYYGEYVARLPPWLDGAASTRFGPQTGCTVTLLARA